MKHSEPYLEGLARLAREAAKHLLKEKNLHDSMRVAVVCLYGSAAQIHFGQRDKYKDFDLQIFLSRKGGYRKNDAARLNRHGAPWKLGEYEGRRVEGFFGLFQADVPSASDLVETIRLYISNHASPRWKGHRSKPFLILWPIRADWMRAGEG